MSTAGSAPLRVAVLAGGLSFEREVSLRSGHRVADALRQVGLDVTLLDADATLIATLQSPRPDVVFPTLHGGEGEDGAVRTVLDLLELPYVGSPPASCRRAYDKPTAKAAVAFADVPTPPWVTLAHRTFRELGAAPLLDRIVRRLGLPLMVKPAQGGSALGAVPVHDADDLPAAMMHCFSYGDTALLERFVDGRELAVSVVERDSEPVALPPVEVSPGSGVYDYSARYTVGATEYHAPARLTDAELAAAQEVALTAHRVLGLRHLSRTDLVLDRAGSPQFLEVNVAPGMTETSLFPMAVGAAGLTLSRVYADLLTAAGQG